MAVFIELLVKALLFYEYKKECGASNIIVIKSKYNILRKRYACRNAYEIRLIHFSLSPSFYIERVMLIMFFNFENKTHVSIKPVI